MNSKEISTRPRSLQIAALAALMLLAAPAGLLASEAGSLQSQQAPVQLGQSGGATGTSTGKPGPAEKHSRGSRALQSGASSGSAPAGGTQPRTGVTGVPSKGWGY